MEGLLTPPLKELKPPKARELSEDQHFIWWIILKRTSRK